MDLIPQPLYETDEYHWLLEQIGHLQSGEMTRIDRGNLIQYLSEMSKSEERALGSAFEEALMHMLKFAVQPEKASRSWASSIVKQQHAIEDLLTPSMQTLHAARLFKAAYPRAVRHAAAETGLPKSKFPEFCPWTMEQVQAYEPPNLVSD